MYGKGRASDRIKNTTIGFALIEDSSMKAFSASIKRLMLVNINNICLIPSNIYLSVFEIISFVYENAGETRLRHNKFKFLWNHRFLNLCSFNYLKCIRRSMYGYMLLMFKRASETETGATLMFLLNSNNNKKKGKKETYIMITGVASFVLLPNEIMRFLCIIYYTFSFLAP